VSQSAAADRGEAATLSLDPFARSRRLKNDRTEALDINHPDVYYPPRPCENALT
jgi:hypothetical protein